MNANTTHITYRVTADNITKASNSYELDGTQHGETKVIAETQIDALRVTKQRNGYRLMRSTDGLLLPPTFTTAAEAKAAVEHGIAVIGTDADHRVKGWQQQGDDPALENLLAGAI